MNNIGQWGQGQEADNSPGDLDPRAVHKRLPWWSETGFKRRKTTKLP